MCCNGEGRECPAALVGGASSRGFSNCGVSPPPPCRPEQEMTMFPRQGCPDLINIVAAARGSHNAVTGAATAALHGVKGRPQRVLTFLSSFSFASFFHPPFSPPLPSPVLLFLLNLHSFSFSFTTTSSSSLVLFFYLPPAKKYLFSQR